MGLRIGHKLVTKQQLLQGTAKQNKRGQCSQLSTKLPILIAVFMVMGLFFNLRLCKLS